MEVQKYSSSLAQTTRVKRQRKTPRKTVGITLPPKLIEEARKKGLNISRICEEALKSVLDYLPSQNLNEKNKSLNPWIVISSCLISKVNTPRYYYAGTPASWVNMTVHERIAEKAPKIS